MMRVLAAVLMCAGVGCGGVGTSGEAPAGLSLGLTQALLPPRSEASSRPSASAAAQDQCESWGPQWDFGSERAPAGSCWQCLDCRHSPVFSEEEFLSGLRLTTRADRRASYQLSFPAPRDLSGQRLRIVMAGFAELPLITARAFALSRNTPRAALAEGGRVELKDGASELLLNLDAPTSHEEGFAPGRVETLGVLLESRVASEAQIISVALESNAE